MKKIISLIGFTFVLNLSFAQTVSQWYSPENCSWIQTYSILTNCQTIENNKSFDILLYKPNRKLFIVEQKFIDGKLQFRRKYLPKTVKITCN